MAKGDTPKVKDKKSWTKFNLSIRDDIPLKPPWGSSKQSSFPDIRRQSTKKLLYPHTHEDLTASLNSRDSVVPEPVRAIRSSQQLGQDMNMEPHLLSSVTPNSAEYFDDSDTHVSSPYGVRGEMTMTRKTSQPKCKLSADNVVEGRDKAAASPARPPMNNPTMLNYDQTPSVSDTTDSGSAPTQILIMPYSSDKGTERLPRSSHEHPTDLGHLTATGPGPQYEQIDYIADLVQLVKATQATSYISARDMSLHLDNMAGQGFEGDLQPLQRSLTPFLGTPSSYAEFLAVATSSVKGHTDLFRIYVSAWIFMCVTESRVEGLRLNFVLVLTVCKLTATQRDTTASKPAGLAMLVKQTWFSDISTRSTDPIVLEASASSTRTHRSFLEDTDSPKSLVVTDVSHLPHQHERTQPLASADIPRYGPRVTTVAPSQNTAEPANPAENQQHRIYHYAKVYLGNTTGQLTGRFLEVWSWLDPIGRLPRFGSENMSVLSEIEAERFFIAGRVFDVLSIPRMPSITARSIHKFFAGTSHHTLLPHIERFVVVRANKGYCDAIAVYVPDTSKAVETQAMKSEEAVHPILYDTAHSHNEIAAGRSFKTTFIPVRMVSGEILSDGTRLNTDHKRRLGWNNKVKEVGFVTGERHVNKLQSYFTEVSEAERDMLIPDDTQGNLETEDDWIDLSSAEQRQLGADATAVAIVSGNEAAGGESQQKILATLYGFGQTIVNLATTLTMRGAA